MLCGSENEIEGLFYDQKPNLSFVTYIENGLFKIKSSHALEIGMVQGLTLVVSLTLEIDIVPNAVKLEKTVC